VLNFALDQNDNRLVILVGDHGPGENTFWHRLAPYAVLTAAA
jgi:hypothetical protein